jgi:hypothetical protein
MKPTLAILAGLLLLITVTTPARAGQVSAEDHAAHHPDAEAGKATPAPKPATASNARLDELVKKMNGAQGQAKVDAIAEVLTALVQEHQRMHGNMAGMKSMMPHAEAGNRHGDTK